MKVVLFCGGLGVRLREYAASIPKPMVLIGDRPILWHIMKYYAHFGHNDFVLCLGYRADVVKEYFLEYSEAVSNDFVLTDGGRSVQMLSTDINEWRITFIDTGMRSSIGQRLMAVKEHLSGEDVFLASYGDCLTDAPLDALLVDFLRSGKVASFLGVRPTYPFHVVTQRPDGVVSAFQSVQAAKLRINGGYFMLRQAIFDYMVEGDELVVQPFHRLIQRALLKTYPHDGFWAPMDTLRERQELEALAESGQPPWAVWQRTGIRELVGSPAG